MDLAHSANDQRLELNGRKAFAAFATFVGALLGIWFAAPYIIPHLPAPVIGWSAKTALVASIGLMILNAWWNPFHIRRPDRTRLSVSWRYFVRFLLILFALSSWIIIGIAAKNHVKRDNEQRSLPHP